MTSLLLGEKFNSLLETPTAFKVLVTRFSKFSIMTFSRLSAASGRLFVDPIREP
jgi:hypothetical protein